MPVVIFEKPEEARKDTRNLEKGKCGTTPHSEEVKTEEHGNYMLQLAYIFSSRKYPAI